MEPPAGLRITGQLVLGVSIAVVGVLFTLDNLHILRARDYLQFWPLALIAIGFMHIAQARTSAGTAPSAVILASTASPRTAPCVKDCAGPGESISRRTRK